MRRHWTVVLGVWLLLAAGVRAGEPREDWQQLVSALSLVPREGQPQAVQREVQSRVRFADDPDDVWQTPLETLGSGRGDCEDFAIAKFALLHALGWGGADLRLGYGRVHQGGHDTEPHVVVLLWWAPAGDFLVLDNLREEVQPLAQRGDLSIVFSFADTRVWPGVSRAAPRAGTSFRRWLRAQERVLAEGTMRLAPPALAGAPLARWRGAPGD